MPKSAHPPATPSFESALSELEAIVQNMENGQMSLEASLGAYQRGMELLKHCQSTLTAAEQKIAVLEGGELHQLPAISDNGAAT
ncbi:MAG: exodeoxyribonuclease VII small subunit [Rhodocyclaceae bacterium]|nr:exodeoxyribonuclease VII small subunit [Rhodocyclaceae bacterium]